MSKKYVVACGKTLTTQKGIKTAGDIVDAGCFINEEAFESLIDRGFVQSEGDYKKIAFYGTEKALEVAPSSVAEPEPEPEPEPAKEQPPIMKFGGAKKAKKD